MRPWDGVSEDPRAYASFPAGAVLRPGRPWPLPVRGPQLRRSRRTSRPSRTRSMATAGPRPGGRHLGRGQRRARAGPRRPRRRAALPGHPDLLALSGPSRDRDEPHQSRAGADAVRARPPSLFRRPRPGASFGPGERRLAARRPQRAKAARAGAATLGLPPATGRSTSWCSTMCSRAGSARRWSSGRRPAGRSRSRRTSSIAIWSSTSRRTALLLRRAGQHDRRRLQPAHRRRDRYRR